MPRFVAFALALSCVLLVPAVHAAPPPDVEVTTCGQVIPKKALGYLTADLDCTGFTGVPANVDPSDGGAAVYLEKKSRLDLRGFTITGGINGVLCDTLRCAHGKYCSRGPCEIFSGILVGPGPSVTTASRGISGFRPVVHDLTVSDFHFGVMSFDKMHLTNVVITDSIAAGVAGKGLTVTDTTVTNSGQFGVIGWTDRGKATRLTNSSVTGNGTQPFCGDFACADVAAMRMPRLEGSTCGTSHDLDDGGTWGVCSND